MRWLESTSASLAIPDFRFLWIDDSLAKSDPKIFAIGECAVHAGAIYGLVGPGYEMPAALERLDYTPSYHRNPLVPPWMDGALRTAVAIPARHDAELSDSSTTCAGPIPPTSASSHCR
jgi:hypothetical protein